MLMNYTDILQLVNKQKKELIIRLSREPLDGNWHI